MSVFVWGITFQYLITLVAPKGLPTHKAGMYVLHCTVKVLAAISTIYVCVSNSPSVDCLFSRYLFVINIWILDTVFTKFCLENLGKLRVKFCQEIQKINLLSQDLNSEHLDESLTSYLVDHKLFMKRD